MAKGDKKKKVEKNTPEISLSKLLVNSFTTSDEWEPQVLDHESEQESDTDLMTASFSSQPPLTDKHLERSDYEFHEVQILHNLIIQRYEGEKDRDQFHGEGVAYFHGGHVYKGSFSEGLMNGRGTYTWADRVKYEGEFASNVPQGYGIYTWLDSSSYEGEVFNGIRHGVGTYSCAIASVVYRGQWHHGKRHGKGTIYYNQESSSWYEGDWVSNSREGWGVRCYLSGNTYEGQWRNNLRHGEGRMDWLQLGQRYSGTWENGIQHGQGTHTWFLKRVHGSQYPLRNEYQGQFVQGLRHGEGSFYYASGALYQGQWKGNKKHGQGKFIFKNGRVFEGEFVDDHMAEFPAFCLDGCKTPDLRGIRTHTPLPEDGTSPRCLELDGGDSASTVLGPDMALDITTLLEKFPESRRGMELKQVEFAVLRHITELRSIYTFYSSLGHAPSPDNTFLLSRLQLWRLLKDCSAHPGAITLAQVDRCIAGEDVSAEEVHLPFSTMLLRKFLRSVVVLAYHTYHKDLDTSGNTPVLVSCFSKLMNEDIIPNAKTVKGLLFSHPVRAVVAANYIQRCWEIYQAFCKPRPTADSTMTTRDFILMFKELALFDAELTTRRLLEVISTDTPVVFHQEHYNLDLEMTFLEFFEVLLGCAEVKGHLVEDCGTEGVAEPGPPPNTWRGTPVEDSRESPLHATKRPSTTTGALVNNSNPNTSPSSPKSTEVGKSKEVLQTSTHEGLEPRHSPRPEGKLTSETGELAGGSATLSSVTERRDEGSSGAAGVSPGSGIETNLSSRPPHPNSTEPSEDRWAAVVVAGGEGPGELEAWVQRTQQFFSQVFYPAYNRSLLLNREVQEHRLRQAACARINLAKAKERARLREVWEAEEEERRREEEEDEEAERDGVEDEPNPSPQATPVASATSVAVMKQPPAAAAKKKKK
ncbi:radial spoke head 10 homolog B [Osmerus eperlanus]|uniref:radial spoke head 10 homolog B n=1 Tax=Osmerus eperlanus TaxID=29151 RepID=UPI002E14DA77